MIKNDDQSPPAISDREIKEWKKTEEWTPSTERESLGFPTQKIAYVGVGELWLTGHLRLPDVKRDTQTSFIIWPLGGALIKNISITYLAFLNDSAWTNCEKDTITIKANSTTSTRHRDDTGGGSAFGYVNVFMMLWRNNAYRQVLLLLQRGLLLPKPIPELNDPFVHRSHLQVAFVQTFSLLLQLRVLILVEFVPQLDTRTKTRQSSMFVFTWNKDHLWSSVLFWCWIE